MLYLKSGTTGFEEVDPAGVKKRYGIAPELVPDFIALRGDPSDGLPGAPGIGPKTAAELLERHGSLEAAIAGAPDERPRVTAALTEHADELRAFKDIATLRIVALDRPPDRATDLKGGRGGPRLRAEPARRAPRAGHRAHRSVMVERGKAVIMAACHVGYCCSSGRACWPRSRPSAGRSTRGTRGQAQADSWVVRASAETDPDQPVDRPSPPAQAGPAPRSARPRARAAAGLGSQGVTIAAASPLPARDRSADRRLEIPPRSAQPRDRRGLGTGRRRHAPLGAGDAPQRLQLDRLDHDRHGHGRLVRGAVHRSADRPGRAWRVAFESVRRNAQVWLNGYEIGSIPTRTHRSAAGHDAEAGRAEPADRARRQHQGRSQPARGLVELGRDHGPGVAPAAGRLDSKDLGVTRAGLRLPLWVVRRPGHGRQPHDRCPSRDGGGPGDLPGRRTVTAAPVAGKVRSVLGAAISLNVSGTSSGGDCGHPSTRRSTRCRSSSTPADGSSRARHAERHAQRQVRRGSCT